MLNWQVRQNHEMDNFFQWLVQGGDMTQKILFLCPHAAAKSVLAAAYFNRLARERGLDFVADAAGTEPDELVSPSVVKLLFDEGIDVASHKPRRVTELELHSAYRVISMGCALEDLAIAPEAVEEWLDLPAPSQDLLGASQGIRSHLELLLDEIS
jgi:arsenate reductase (thioredoxin)